LAEASSAICVQRFDDSRNSAIHTTYRISLRSSSLREPRYPLLRVVLVMMHRQGRCIITLVWFGLVFVGLDRPTRLSREGKPSPPSLTNECEKGRLAASPKRSLKRPDTEGSRVCIDRFNDPSAGSPTETLLRLLLPLGGRV
jgi:hypothetical protein